MLGQICTKQSLIWSNLLCRTFEYSLSMVIVDARSGHNYRQLKERERESLLLTVTSMLQCNLSKHFAFMFQSCYWLHHCVHFSDMSGLMTRSASWKECMKRLATNSASQYTLFVYRFHDKKCLCDLPNNC